MTSHDRLYAYNIRVSAEALSRAPSLLTTMSSGALPSITILYFAAASTATGQTTETLPLPSSDPLPLSSLSELLAARYPKTGLDKILESSQWSVDAEMVEDPSSVFLKGGEEVAVICPVSGG